MEYAVGAKSTKPGSRATSRKRLGAGEKPPRVPVGVLHAIDLSGETSTAMYSGVCGEAALLNIDGSWEDDFPNERCEQCSEEMWKASFSEAQAELLKGQ